jgi:hypothetical protein
MLFRDPLLWIRECCIHYPAFQAEFLIRIRLPDTTPKWPYVRNIHTPQCCGSGRFHLGSRIREVLSRIPDPGGFISAPRSGSIHFLIPDPDPNIFNLGSRILQEKWIANLLFSCFLCFQEQMLRRNHSQKDQDSGKNSSWIWIQVPGGKKSTGSESATLLPRTWFQWPKAYF